MSEVEIDETSEEDKNEGSVRELLSTVFWALTIALVLRTFIFQPFHIPSGSMSVSYTHLTLPTICSV